MGFFSTTLARSAITEVFKAVLAEANSLLNPDEIVLILQQAEVDADKTQGGELFPRIDHSGATGYQKFLKFFKSVEVLSELQKPLNDRGKPDADILVEAFKRSVLEHQDIDKCLPDLMPLWMTAFVESYFEQVKGSRFKVAKEQYLEQLAYQVRNVKFIGIAVSDSDIEQQEVLAQIFVMPDVREEKSRKIDNILPTVSISVHYSEEAANDYTDSLEQNALLEEQKAWAIRDRSAPRISAYEVLDRVKKKKAVVLGAPGSGKTILVSYFALMLCKTIKSDPGKIGLKVEDDYLPVVVRIRDWILQPKMGLLEYLRSNAEASLACKELPTGFFEHWLERGKALILLDGLDEVVDEAQRRNVAEQIESFLRQYKYNPAVITSRPAGYRWDFFNLDEFPHYTLESFDDRQVATFIDHWYDSRLKDDPAQAERRKADLQKAFARNERIRLLAKNPLLLTIITLIHRYQAELPRRRCDLYEIAVKTLLTQWDLGKEIKWDKDTLHYLKQDDLLYLLKKLAYWIHSKGSVGETEGGTLIKKNDLIEQLRKEIQTRKKCEFDEAEEEAKRFIEFIRKRTGLLNEQGRECYAFVHKTFQEYLTAEEIYSRHKRENNTEIIWSHFLDRLHDQHWREVLLLLVSKLEGLQAQEAIQTVLDANSEYEQWLHRDLLFAGWCLTEDPPELTMEAEDWVGEILDRLVELAVGASEQTGLKISHEVKVILHCFGATTIEGDLWVKLQAHKDRIDNFQMLAFQASLGKETDVIEALKSLGYSNATALLNHIQSPTPIFRRYNERDSYIRYVALEMLVQLGGTNLDIVREVISLLRVEANSYLRSSTTTALINLGNTNPEVISRLLFLLGDPASDVRSSAAETLGELGNNSPEVINGLLSLLDDQEFDVHSRAIVSLVQLGNTNPEVISRLLVLLGGHRGYASHAEGALSRLVNIDLAVISELVSLLGNGNSAASYASRILIQLSKNSDAIRPEVVQWLEQNQNDDGIGNAIDCLWSIVYGRLCLSEDV
jgi:hypothetical protein